MSQRRVNTQTWLEDWFINLPHEYKLFYLYIEVHCDQTGVWRPNKSIFQQTVLNGKFIILKDFLKQINRNEDEQDTSNRIRVLENGNWFLNGIFTEQLGYVFKIKTGAHRGALKTLAINNIHPSEITGFDWLRLETLDLQQLKEIAYGKTLYEQSIDDILSIYGHRGMRNEERGMRNEEKEDSVKETNFEKVDRCDLTRTSKVKLNAGKPPLIKSVYEVYGLDWDMLQQIPKSDKALKKETVDLWKQFVDFLIDHDNQGFTKLFTADYFLSLMDMQTLCINKHFYRDKWKRVIEKVLAAPVPVTKSSVLFFRLKDFIDWSDKDITKANKKSVESSLNSNTSDITKQEKW